MSNPTVGLTQAGEMLDNRAGSYRIVPSGPAYCAGIVPDDGYEVVRAELHTWVPLDQAFAFIEAHLKGIGRPVQAFCGIELRVPAPLTLDNWSTFNIPYLEQLRKWGLMHENYSGVCRSNIALDLYPPKVTSLCAFSYTVPTKEKVKTFLLAGQADIGSDGKIIAEGDIGLEAMRKRTLFTIDTVANTLKKLGASWQETTRIALFHVHDIPDLWGAEVLGKIGEPIRKGILVYRARPPIAAAEVELEARAIRQELVLSAR